jgi:hypothetical protein
VNQESLISDIASEALRKWGLIKHTGATDEHLLELFRMVAREASEKVERRTKSALQFYAKESNYDYDLDEHGNTTNQVQADGGELARDALDALAAVTSLDRTKV